MLNPRLCDTALPSNLLDSDFSVEYCSPARRHEECTFVQVETCYYKLVAILGEITVSSHAVVAPSRTEIAAFAVQMEDARTKLPYKLKMRPIEETFVDSPAEIVDRVRLEFVHQKSLCVLYRRFMGCPGFEEEHGRCVAAAMTIVRLSISVLEASQPGAQLAQVRIQFVRHIHDFLFAGAVLCAALKVSRGDSAELTFVGVPRQDDIRTMLLQACRMWNTPGIPSSKAQLGLHTMLHFLGKQSSPAPSFPRSVSVDTSMALETPGTMAAADSLISFGGMHQQGQGFGSDPALLTFENPGAMEYPNDYATLSWLAFQEPYGDLTVEAGYLRVSA